MSKSWLKPQIMHGKAPKVLRTVGWREIASCSDVGVGERQGRSDREDVGWARYRVFDFPLKSADCYCVDFDPRALWEGLDLDRGPSRKGC